LAHLLVATGFNREARIVAQPGVVAVAGGGAEAELEAKLGAQVSGAIGIASFGLAGALRDGLAIGDWVVATSLVGAVEAETDPAWRDAALARLPGARPGIAYADGRMIDSIAGKRRLGLEADASIVDMESHIAAKVAQRHGLPFAVIRCVSDRVDHMLPHAITVSMRPGGAIDGMAMAASLLRRPGQLPDLIATGWYAGKAFRALSDGNRALGPRLGFSTPSPDRKMVEYSVFVIGGEDDETISLVPSEIGAVCRLVCTVRGEKHMADERDFFEALCTLRRRVLEPKGLIPFCYGASLKVWPSGMARDMGRGLKAYKIEVGAQASELVGIFESGHDVIPAQVAVQAEYAREWIASLRR
jgi:hypothetical protein